MADIELVIKLSEETYSGLKDSWILDRYIDNIIKAILDGTPLKEYCESCIYYPTDTEDD